MSPGVPGLSIDVSQMRPGFIQKIEFFFFWGGGGDTNWKVTVIIEG